MFEMTWRLSLLETIEQLLGGAFGSHHGSDGWRPIPFADVADMVQDVTLVVIIDLCDGRSIVSIGQPEPDDVELSILVGFGRIHCGFCPVAKPLTPLAWRYTSEKTEVTHNRA
jgi:hypothetical protein